MAPPAYGSRPAIEPRLITWPEFRALKPYKKCKVTRYAMPEERTFDQELRDRDESENVGRKHALRIRIQDTPNTINTMNKPSVVHFTNVSNSSANRAVFTHQECRHCASPGVLSPTDQQPESCQTRPAALSRYFRLAEDQTPCAQLQLRPRHSSGHRHDGRVELDWIRPIHTTFSSIHVVRRKSDSPLQRESQSPVEIANF